MSTWLKGVLLLTAMFVIAVVAHYYGEDRFLLWVGLGLLAVYFGKHYLR